MNQRGLWQLILMAREGDRQAIEELFFATFRSAYLMMHSLTSNKAKALELLRKGYVKVFQSLEDADYDIDFSEYLHSVLIDCYLKNVPNAALPKFNDTYDAAFSAFRPEEIEIHDFDTLPVLSVNKSADDVLKALHSLPKEQRLCADLFFFSQCSPESIAKLLNTTEERVFGALHKMRTAIVPLIDKVLLATPSICAPDALSCLPWALRNTKAYTLSDTELTEFHQSIIEQLVSRSVLDTSISESDPFQVENEIQMVDMKPIREHRLLKEIFSLRTLIIVLLVLVLAGLGIGLRQLKAYNKRHREIGQIISRTTLPISTTAFASEKFIFSTELAMPTEEPTTAETTTEAKTEPETEKETTTKPHSDFTYTESGSTVVITGYTGSDSNPTIPDTINGKKVIGIGDKAFANSTITGIKLPSSLQGIGKSAFHSCTGLLSISLPPNVTLIESDAFRNCINLKSISLSDNLQKIGANAFYKCASLSSITFPSTVTYLGDAAFSGCTTLGSITIPNSVTYVGNSLFYECKSLTKCSVGASSKLKALGESMFYDCTCLTGFSVPANVKTIPENCFFGCRSLSSVSMPSGVTSIGSGAFTDCISLSSIKLSASLLHIEKNAFTGCSSLKTVAIPSGTTSIGASAFQNCSNLTSVSIPATVTTIGERAFLGCDDVVFTCPEKSAAAKYADDNHIDVYGRTTEMAYANANTIE